LFEALHTWDTKAPQLLQGRRGFESLETIRGERVSSGWGYMAKKTSSKKHSTKKRSTKGRGKTEKVMHEYKHGTLKSGGKKKVTSRKQAVAIALNEARESGARIPKKKKSA